MILDGIVDEDKWLAEGIAGIQHHAFYMHRALVLPFRVRFVQFPNLSEYLISISIFLRTRTISETLSNTRLRCSPSSEPRGFRLTSTTSSVNFSFSSLGLIDMVFVAGVLIWMCFVCWWSICADMRAFDELRKLEMFFKDESRHGVSIIDLYELVQHAGNILPRL